MLRQVPSTDAQEQIDVQSLDCCNLLLRKELWRSAPEDEVRLQLISSQDTADDPYAGRRGSGRTTG